KRSGGARISRGHLYWILSNLIYVGRLRHKGQSHDGLHSAIIDRETWDRVRQKLESQTRARRMSQPDDHSTPILLTHSPSRCSVIPVAGIKLGIGRRLCVASDAEQRTEGVERVEAPVEPKREFVEVGL